MSKVRGCKEGLPHDPSVNMPTEQKASESNKQKIAKIHDMFPSCMKDNIAKILQFYDDDESKAFDAITRDGGREALSNWADSGSSKSKNNKNKKKKKKARRDTGIAATASFDADDSSSLHSGGNVEADGEKESPRTENGNGLPDAVDANAPLERMLNDRLSCSEPEPESLDSEKENKSEPKPPQERNSPTAPEASLGCDRTTPEAIASCPSPPSAAPERQEEPAVRKEKYRSSNEGSSKPSPRQRTSSFRRSKSSSISEDSSSQHNPQAAATPTKRGFDKCKKDLNRQTISLQRILIQVEKGFDEANKKAKTQFSELQKLHEKRQKEIEAELNERKMEAFNLCKSRQDLAVELKRRLDRTASLPEAEWTELRSDVKQFVTERKYDDELGKTIWFQWEDISQVISNFGEVPAVKNVYSQRSHSALGSNNPGPSPSSSLANEENESSADKNDVGNLSDTAEDETPVPEKEPVPAFTKPYNMENNRTRVYSNKQFERSKSGRFPNNRGSGYYRGNRGGGGYNRPNYRGNNYQYNRHGNYSNYDSHSYVERDGRTNEGSYHGDRNANNNRDNKSNRNPGRGHVNYRYNNNPRGYNRGGHRFNAEHTETEPTANAANANTEKTNVVNGYVNSNN